MKKQTRLYNIILPIWLLVLFPQILVFIIPGNLVVDCAVLFLTLRALKHTQKGAVMKQLWWKFWLLGFAADAVGVVWLFLGGFAPLWLTETQGISLDWHYDTLRYLMHNPFGHPAAFLWTLVGVAGSGVCIYFFDKRAMKSCGLLTDREKRVTALAMAIATAPYLFFIPTHI